MSNYDLILTKRSQRQIARGAEMVTNVLNFPADREWADGVRGMCRILLANGFMAIRASHTRLDAWHHPNAVLIELPPIWTLTMAAISRGRWVDLRTLKARTRRRAWAIKIAASVEKMLREEDKRELGALAELVRKKILSGDEVNWSRITS